MFWKIFKKSLPKESPKYAFQNKHFQLDFSDTLKNVLEDCIKYKIGRREYLTSSKTKYISEHLFTTHKRHNYLYVSCGTFLFGLDCHDACQKRKIKSRQRE